MVGFVIVGTCCSVQMQNGTIREDSPVCVPRIEAVADNVLDNHCRSADLLLLNFGEDVAH